MAKRKFGELELEILHILKNDKKMSVKQVLTILGEQNKYTTIMTVMNRLCDKKALYREKIGHQYVYWLAPQTEEIPSFIKQFKNKILGFRTSEMVNYLLTEAEDITEEELAAMEKLIQKAREERKKDE